MDITSVFQIAAVGIIIAVLNQVLDSVGRKEQATMTTIAGVVIVLLVVIGYISNFFSVVQTLFQF